MKYIGDCLLITSIDLKIVQTLKKVLNRGCFCFCVLLYVSSIQAVQRIPFYKIGDVQFVVLCQDTAPKNIPTAIQSIFDLDKNIFPYGDYTEDESYELKCNFCSSPCAEMYYEISQQKPMPGHMNLYKFIICAVCSDKVKAYSITVDQQAMERLNLIKKMERCEEIDKELTKTLTPYKIRTDASTLLSEMIFTHHKATICREYLEYRHKIFKMLASKLEDNRIKDLQILLKKSSEPSRTTITIISAILVQCEQCKETIFSSEMQDHARKHECENKKKYCVACNAALTDETTASVDHYLTCKKVDGQSLDKKQRELFDSLVSSGQVESLRQQGGCLDRRKKELQSLEKDAFIVGPPAATDTASCQTTWYEILSCVRSIDDQLKQMDTGVPDEYFFTVPKLNARTKPFETHAFKICQNGYTLRASISLNTLHASISLKEADQDQKCYVSFHLQLVHDDVTDDLLPWPFKSKITLQLVHPVEKRPVYEKVLCLEKHHNQSDFKQPVDASHSGWFGDERFMLWDEAKRYQFKEKVCFKVIMDRTEISNILFSDD